MRRSNEVMGMVNFPVDSEEYKSTNEGGMFVELWCIETEYNSCGVCCGYANTSSTMSESLVGTENKINTDNFDEIEKGKDPNDWEQRFFLEEDLFPNVRNDACSDQYKSLPLIACITMGSTGWSGSNKDHDYWRCKYDDLNESGKAVYDSLRSAYPKSKLLLVTWLDT